MRIGVRIKQLRKSHSMSQATFASHIDISQGTLSEIERDKFYPSVETVVSISKVFGVKTDWLLRGDNVSGDLGMLEPYGEQFTQKIYNLIRDAILKISEEIKEDVNTAGLSSTLISDIWSSMYNTSLTLEEIDLLNEYRLLLPKDKKEIQAIIALKHTMHEYT
ncbi:helix-turn-helix transcriptional regulator [Paenibacillus sp. 19GGS1-52]|uniref:helix-turn-helix domain-containing protein n=1 Tax=Paenibacillus sp. 19GGS1-52 TaxID=2758563 RepID=UPI001EFA7A42|nr:helix-turn-helix transcriptional regulator [Paenibacillus sp. 19GGS1-52]ULO07051.1 helix-turn-helix transcriptional regulator [Paenibacillus sp. 19GGS1-52]